MFRRILLGCVFGLMGVMAAGVARAEDQLVIYDNDWDTAQSLVPLMADPHIRLLGLTVVTGDGWEAEESAHLRRFLELVGRTDVPVYDGAVFPLVNTVDRTLAWEKTYGVIPWKGAWNDNSFGPQFHAHDPYRIVDAPEGPPKLSAARETAVNFLIRAVHEHPHQVTIYAAGPLTNIALAIRIDPEFAALAKQLVIMGGMLDTNLLQVTGDANYNSDFNFIFDPEAAHITLTSDWAKVVIVGEVSNGVIFDKDALARMQAKRTAAVQYIEKNAMVGLPMWDELAAALIVDPTLVTKSVEARMDVDLNQGVNYGHAHVWPEKFAPHQGETKVTVVQAVDSKRFVDLYVKDAMADWPKGK